MRALKLPVALCLLVVAVLSVLSPKLALSAEGSQPTPPAHRPSVLERQTFQQKMAAVPLPGQGCFVARFGDLTWHKVKCRPASKHPNPMARGPRPFYVGAGTDYFTHPTGLITAATGSFDAVTNVTAESGPTYYSPTVAHTNVYSLQVNANTFSPAACAGIANCLGWEQFLYSQTQCSGACGFIEYWLLNHTQPCPAGQGWNYYPGTPTTVPGCYLNTAVVGVPVQPLADLGGLQLSGKVAGGTDTVSISVANGDVYTQNNPSIAGLGTGWTGAEYNLVGDCCAYGAYFTAGPATLKIRLATQNGTQGAPTCSTSGTGATAETNNLDLTGPCTATGGAQPAISFAESGGGPLPPGLTQGDTHLTTIGGLHYDFQEVGEYILAQAGTDLLVQSRQAYIGPSHAVSWNVAISVQMGRDSIIVYPNASTIVNLMPTPLADGASLALDAGVTVTRHGTLFTISRPEGDTVQANALGDHIDATVQLGAAEAPVAQGLLITRNGGLMRRGGALLSAALTADTLHNYAESWRVEPSKSLFPEKGRPTPSGPLKVAAKDAPTKAAQDKARAACSRAGITNATLLKDCVLDVAVTGNEALADAYVYAPKPRRALSLH
jgi:hypothetical protein